MYVRTVGITVALCLALATAARADQWYSVEGRDTFRIEGGNLRGEITYAGTQRLVATRDRGATRFSAVVDYRRLADGTAEALRGSFRTVIDSGGSQHDANDDDPDYLTILNQPFAIELDARTFADLRALRGPVPFDFAAPMTGAPLHGSLRRLPDAVLSGVRVLGIAFRAEGPLHGALPDRPALSVTGTISMNGTAYYRFGNTLLLALDTTIAIDGNLDAADRRNPVAIVYRRTIRPLGGPRNAKP